MEKVPDSSVLVLNPESFLYPEADTGKRNDGLSPVLQGYLFGIGNVFLFGLSLQFFS